MRSFVGVAVLLALAATANAEPVGLRVAVPAKVLPPQVGNVVNSKTIFLNRCTGGCKVSIGFTDSRTNHSSIALQNGTLSAFSYGDTAWNQVVTCVKNVFSRFNVTITDVDPGPNVDHFEVMVGGTAPQIGYPSNYLGIAESACSDVAQCAKYMPNALVFDFAGGYSGYANKVNEICATAAQELAHTWSLDHAADPMDPMTYTLTYTGIRQFKDNVQCGSDCVNGVSPPPFNLTCGTGATGGTHPCISTGTATQNDVQTLLALFGPAGTPAPTLKLTNPTNGSAVQPGFMINVDCTSPDGIQEVNLSIDGLPKATLTAAPFNFTAPASLAEGPHKISVLCGTNKQAIATVTADVVVGTACVNGACDKAGYICFGGACIAGPDAPGGLGAGCAGNADCISGACASDGTMSTCVIPCDRSVKNCPDGFGCIDDGTGTGGGVCWIGADDGTGCGCESGGGNGPGAMLLALGIAATLVTRKRRN